MALSLDHEAFINITTLGQGDIGGAMRPPPEGVWGMPPEMLRTLPGYDPDVAKNPAQARGIMEKLGYGPGKRRLVTAYADSGHSRVGWEDRCILPKPAVLISTPEALADVLPHE